MSKMRTGWVIKDEEGCYYDNPSAFFESDIESATIFTKRRHALKQKQFMDEYYAYAPTNIVKVEWQPRVVKEVG